MGGRKNNKNKIVKYETLWIKITWLIYHNNNFEEVKIKMEFNF